MVHSSISDMQPMYKGSASELVRLLLKLAGPDRTLAMPAFYLGSPQLYNREYYRKNGLRCAKDAIADGAGDRIIPPLARRKA